MEEPVNGGNENPAADERKAAIRKGKRPISKIYEFKILNEEPEFANFQQGGTSRNDDLKEEEYDYNHYIADYFFTVWKMTRRNGFPEITHPLCREIFNLCMRLWVDFGGYYPVENVDVNLRD
ncbi:hypothetical protein HAX54_008057 [Datura stramonium]|uniref:Uncharacterized protein n=1 Tax=Datura stramonium TaxID=4076 RepID=A0ABS8TFB9_DATST|nr:hypothetical protein [Datura stramonium]